MRRVEVVGILPLAGLPLPLGGDEVVGAECGADAQIMVIPALGPGGLELRESVGDRNSSGSSSLYMSLMYVAGCLLIKWTHQVVTVAVIAKVMASLEEITVETICKGDEEVSVPVIVVARALTRDDGIGGGSAISSSSFSFLSFVTGLLSLAQIPPGVALSVIADVSASLVVVIVDALFIVDMVVSARVMAGALFTWGSEILS